MARREEKGTGKDRRPTPHIRGEGKLEEAICRGRKKRLPQQKPSALNNIRGAVQSDPACPCRKPTQATGRPARPQATVRGEVHPPPSLPQ